MSLYSIQQAPALRATDMSAKLATNDLEAFWMPFTANRAVQEGAAPARSRRRHVLHHRRRAPACSTAPPACGASTPAIAGRRSSRRSASRSASSISPAPSRWAIRAPSNAPRSSSTSRPPGFDHVFFTNSGSESVETALKIALAYHRAKGNALEDPPDRPRARLSRRQFRRHLGRRHRQQPQDGSARC